MTLPDSWFDSTWCLVLLIPTNETHESYEPFLRAAMAKIGRYHLMPEDHPRIPEARERILLALEEQKIPFATVDEKRCIFRFAYRSGDTIVSSLKQARIVLLDEA